VPRVLLLSLLAGRDRLFIQQTQIKHVQNIKSVNVLTDRQVLPHLLHLVCSTPWLGVASFPDVLVNNICGLPERVGLWGVVLARVSGDTLYGVYKYARVLTSVVH